MYSFIASFAMLPRWPWTPGYKPSSCLCLQAAGAIVFTEPGTFFLSCSAEIQECGLFSLVLLNFMLNSISFQPIILRLSFGKFSPCVFGFCLSMLFEGPHLIPVYTPLLDFSASHFLLCFWLVFPLSYVRYLIFPYMLAHPLFLKQIFFSLQTSSMLFHPI